MKVKYSPQIHERYQVNYQFNKDNVIRIETRDLEEGTADVMFVDVTPIESEIVYLPTDFITNIYFDESSGEMHLELLNFVRFDATDEELFPKEFEPEIVEFPIDGNVMKLGAATQGEIEPQLSSEVKLLKKQIQELTEQIDFRDELIHELAVMVYGE